MPCRTALRRVRVNPTLSKRLRSCWYPAPCRVSAHRQIEGSAQQTRRAAFEAWHGLETRTGRSGLVRARRTRRVATSSRPSSRRSRPRLSRSDRDHANARHVQADLVHRRADLIALGPPVVFCPDPFSRPLRRAHCRNQRTSRAEASAAARRNEDQRPDLGSVAARARPACGRT